METINITVEQRGKREKKAKKNSSSHGSEKAVVRRMC